MSDSANKTRALRWRANIRLQHNMRLRASAAKDRPGAAMASDGLVLKISHNLTMIPLYGKEQRADLLASPLRSIRASLFAAVESLQLPLSCLLYPHFR